MGQIVHEKFVRAYWATSVADITAPTVAEIGAATYLGVAMTADGVNITATNNRASINLMDTEKIAEHPGTRSIQKTLKFARETEEADDVAWELFDHNTAGFLILAWLVEGTDPVATDRVEVYEAKAFEPQHLATAPDQFQQYEVPFALQDWEIKAVVAA